MAGRTPMVACQLLRQSPEPRRKASSSRDSSRRKIRKIGPLEEEPMNDVAVRTGVIALLCSVAIFCGIAFAESRPNAANNSTSAFAVLVGDWTRTQGPYVISIR